MTNPFNDIDALNSTSSSTPSGYLPNGDYDTNNLGDMYNQTVYEGQVSSPNDNAQVQAQVRGTAAWNNVTNKTDTVESYANSFAAMSQSNPQDFYNMQMELYNAGMYGSTKFIPGQFTNADKAAMKAAMGGYLGVVNSKSPNPLTFSEYLGRTSQAGKANGFGSGGSGGGGGGGASRAPLQLTDAATLRQTLQSASQNALHRDLNDTELSHFVDAFHSKETQAYNAANGGATYSSPDASAQAIETVQSTHTDEESQALKASYNDKILQMLGGSASA